MMTSKQERIMRMRYTMICGLLPLKDDKKKLAAAIRRTAEEYGVSVPTVKKYLGMYLEAGTMEVLAPADKKQRTELTDFEKDIRWGLNKFYYTTAKRSLTDAYTLMIKARYYKDGALLEDRPSFYQFRYYYRKHRSASNQIISRQGLSYYQRNERPLLGSGVQEYAAGVGVGMLDSTICDIYLVNEAGQLVGRPVLTACIDAYSGICCGYSLGWEGGSYSIRKLMENVVSDKAAHCRRFGINIGEDVWACHSLPAKLITDKGTEYASENFEQLAELGVIISNLPPYRPELKGTVEKFFDCVQDCFKPHLKGKGLIEPDHRERGVVDYRRQACLTLRQFETVLLRCIIYYNSQRVLENFPFSADMISAGIKPYSAEVWNYCIDNSASVNLIDISPDRIRQVLLPRTAARFTRRGLIVNKLRYRADGFCDEYLDGKTVSVAYDPDNVSTVWLLEDGNYTAFTLIDSRFQGKELEAVRDLKERQKERIRKEQDAQLLAKVQLAEAIETIAAQSDGGTLSPDSIKHIRSTRKQEIERSHLKGGD